MEEKPFIIKICSLDNPKGTELIEGKDYIFKENGLEPISELAKKFFQKPKR